MRKNSNEDFGRQATALLASACVIVGGLLACVLIALAFNNRPAAPLTLCAVYLATILLLMWLGRERPRSGDASGTILQFVPRRRRKEAAVHYEPMRRRQRRGNVFGINEPPSVESVRGLSDGLRNWAPSSRNLRK